MSVYTHNTQWDHKTSVNFYCRANSTRPSIHSFILNSCSLTYFTHTWECLLWVRTILSKAPSDLTEALLPLPAFTQKGRFRSRGVGGDVPPNQPYLTNSTLEEVLKWEEYERQDHTSFPPQIHRLGRVGKNRSDEVWIWFEIWILNLTELCFSNTKGAHKIKDFAPSDKGQKGA